MGSGRIKNCSAQGEMPVLHAISVFFQASDVSGGPEGG